MKRVLDGLLGVLEFVRLRVFSVSNRSVEPIDLGRALLRTLESRKKISISTVYVPNEFTIYLHPNQAAAVKSLEHTLLEELKGVLQEKAEKDSLSFIGPIEVLLKSDDQLTPLEIRVQADFRENEELDPVEMAHLPRFFGGERLFRVVNDQSYPGKLVVIQHNGQRQEFPLHPEVTKIGRGAYCGIRLSDPKAGRWHASIHHCDRAFVIKDLGTSNGTILNGKPVTESPLSDNDVIQIGSTVMEFHSASDRL